MWLAGFVLGMTAPRKTQRVKPRLRALNSSAWKKVVQNFKPQAFRPPFWAKNCHVSTITGALALPRSQAIKWDRRKRYENTQGDYFDVEVVEAKRDDEPCVIILHGLESNGDSPIVRQIASAVEEKFPAWGIYSLNNRGCSGEPYKSPRMYHAGFTDDLDFLVRSFDGKRPLYLMGFSLGGNMILKYLGQSGAEAQRKWNILGAAVMSVPFNLELANAKLSQGFGRVVYARNFLRTLKRKARMAHKIEPSFNLERVLASRTVGELDDSFIAPVWGFESYKDYYTKSDSRQFLPGITTPTLVLHARDDPFIESSTLPTEKDIGSAPIKFVYHERGGHCAFISDKEVGKSFAAEEFVKFVSFVREADELV